jgi:hypothetical protein
LLRTCGVTSSIHLADALPFETYYPYPSAHYITYALPFTSLSPPYTLPFA